MMQLERQKKILDYLNKNRKATTKELSQLLDVSTTTIRTDLNQMDRENLITKTHGGAVYNDRSLDNIELTGRAYFFDERALENQKEKEAIANKAIKLIKNHMCIYLDASSTCYTLGMKLSGFTKLTVITNGINLAMALKDIPGITVILTGGIVTSVSSSIEGLLGEDLLKKIHTDIAFVSARGFSVENGLTDFSIYEADLKRRCVKSSAKTIALIDHTKFNTTSISSYASLDDLNMVITDFGLSENTKDIYEKAGALFCDFGGNSHRPVPWQASLSFVAHSGVSGALRHAVRSLVCGTSGSRGGNGAGVSDSRNWKGGFAPPGQENQSKEAVMLFTIF